MKAKLINSMIFLSGLFFLIGCDDYKEQYSVPGYIPSPETPPIIEEKVENDSILADDPLIRYVGRTVVANNKVSFDWVGTYFEIDATGDHLSVEVEHSGDGTDKLKGSYLNVFVDGELNKTVYVDEGVHTIQIDNLGAKRRTIKIQKRTEGRYGQLTVGKIKVTNGKLYKPASTRKYHIEFIGDSNTCGYGVEGLSPNEVFKLETENCNLTYACILARAFNADYTLIANSGMGIARNLGSATATSKLTMRDYFLRTYNMSATEWSFTSYKPDLFISILGSNDFGGSGDKPNEEQFSGAYATLVDYVRQKYGADVKIMCFAPRNGDQAADYVRRFVESRSSDSNIFYGGSLAGVVTASEDLGSVSHPNYKGQKKIAGFMLPEILKRTGWEANTSEIN